MSERYAQYILLYDLHMLDLSICYFSKEDYQTKQGPNTPHTHHMGATINTVSATTEAPPLKKDSSWILLLATGSPQILLPAKHRIV